VRGADKKRQSVPIAGDVNGRCRMHGGPSPGAPKGNKHALKHGRYTAKAIARRLEIRELLRAMKALAGDGEESYLE
jgi:hypothetical protein